MKALILVGSKKTNVEANAIHDSMSKELKNLNWEIKSIILEDIDLAYCTGCFGCWVQTPGECVIKDYQEIYTILTEKNIQPVFITLPPQKIKENCNAINEINKFA